jgi:signal transduction histidine kinase
MKRKAETALKAWKNSDSRKPLLIYGARQVGSAAAFGESICKWIIELHGGTIEARSQLGHGTAFCIHVPKQQKTEQPA